MAEKVVLTSLGVDIAEATIAEILCAEGEAVTANQELAVAETQKVTFEIEAPSDGIVLKWLIEEGDEVSVGTTIAIIGEVGEDISSLIASPAQEKKEETTQVELAAKPTVKHKIFPAVRKFAAEKGVDLNLLKKEIKGDVITKEDVLKFASATDQDVIVPLTGIRGTIAKRMRLSVDTAAHVTSVIEVDMSKVKKHKSQSEIKTTYLPIIAKQICKAIKKAPKINGIIEDDNFIQKKDVHMSIAVRTDRGLIVPVIRNLDQMLLAEINQTIQQLVAKAEAGTLTAEEMQGGTITLSNGGSFGPILNTPLINLPQVAVVWTGKIEDRPVAVEGQIEIRPMMYLCLSYDHRALDGKDASDFLVNAKKYLEADDKID